MMISRRRFLMFSAAALAAPTAKTPDRNNSAVSMPRRALTDGILAGPIGGFDPWLEIDAGAIQHNAREIARLSGNRPVMAVLKNNAYGLGLETVGRILDRAPEVTGLAVVKPDQALALRSAGIEKPILLMGMFTEESGRELVEADIDLAPFSQDSPDIVTRISSRIARPVTVHLYLDTGMQRLGMSHRRAVPWIREIASRDGVRVAGIFSAFTEEDDFDPEQLRRFSSVVGKAEELGLDLGLRHMASSHGLFFRHDAYLDMVRPGLAIYGAYPADAQERGLASLSPAFRLRARVVRVEQLQVGDSVSYGRDYIAEAATWIATLPVGHADGYPRTAVNGCRVVVNGAVYRVIGAVSASHTIVELGAEPTVAVGDEATLVGWDRPEVHPNKVAEAAGVSVYDILMHLNAKLPKSVIN
jgi:alanine racemase